MRFMMRVEVADVTDEVAVAWRPRDGARGTRRTTWSPATTSRRTPRPPGPACGTWAFEALRIARGEPRLGLDTDHRTIPNEVGWIGGAVHLDKGCYRGQETVARVHTLGRPPRRLTLLHLDGSENRLPTRGADVLHGDTVVGFVGSSARHHELGPIALALVKRNVPLDATLDADGCRPRRRSGRRWPSGNLTYGEIDTEGAAPRRGHLALAASGRRGLARGRHRVRLRPETRRDLHLVVHPDFRGRGWLRIPWLTDIEGPRRRGPTATTGRRGTAGRRARLRPRA